MKSVISALAVVTLLVVATSAFAADYTWSFLSNPSSLTLGWSDSNNWGGAGVPNQPGDFANMIVANTGNIGPISMDWTGDASQTVGRLDVGSTVSYLNMFTIGRGSGDAPLIFDNNGQGAQLNIGGVNGTAANHLNKVLIKCPVQLNDNLTVNVLNTYGQVNIGAGGPITGNYTITKTGPGSLYFNTGGSSFGGIVVNQGKVMVSGPNSNDTISGPVTLNGGIFQLTDDNELPTNTNFYLNGGNFNPGGATQQIGTLTLGGNVETNYGSGIHFANSSAQTWTGMLTIDFDPLNLAGLASNGLYFGADATGLSAAQLSHIQFAELDGDWNQDGNFFAAGIDNTGNVIPVPEPMTLSLLLAGGMGALLRRRSA